jgi:hypothetical protein
MFWEEGFSYKEDILEDLDAAHAFVHRSVRDARANPDWMYYLVPVQDALASGDVTSKTLRYRLGTARRTWKHLRSDQQEKG